MPNTTERWEIVAMLCGQSDRVRFWRDTLGQQELPIVSPMFKWAKLPDLGERLVYELDWQALPEGLQERIIHAIANRFHLGLAQVTRDIERLGVPILAEDVSVMCADQGILYSMLSDGAEAYPHDA